MTAWQTAGTAAFLKMVNGFEGAEDNLEHVSLQGLRSIAQEARALAAMCDDLAAKMRQDLAQQMLGEEPEPERAPDLFVLPRPVPVTPEPYGGYAPRVRSPQRPGIRRYQ